MNDKNKKTILLVEDDVLTSMNEKKQLEKYGYNIIIANTGEKAIEITESSSDIDIILMDINLGIGIDGTEAAEIILKKKDIPVLFLSSYSEKEIVEKTEKITSYGYVVKSSGITVIAASIRMAFRLFESKQEEQKKHRALQNSEQKYRALIENSGTYIFIVDRDGIYLLMNTGGASLFGGKPEDFIGKSIFDIVKPREVAESYYQSNLKIIESGIGRIFESTLELPIGKKTFLINEQVIKDERGNNVAIQSSSIDITGRKQMEDDLVRSNKMLELTQSGANAGSWYWDIVTGKIEWSENMYEIFGMDKYKSFASFEEWRNTLHPEDKIKAEDKINQAIKNKENLINDYRIILPDGSIRWIRALGKCEYNDYNEPLRMYGLCIDITEQKQIEEKLQISENLLKTQFDNSPDLIMIVDRDYRIIQLNKILFKSSNSNNTVDEFIGKDSIEVLPLHVRETVKSRIEQCFISGEVQDFEHEVGENIWARARVVPLPSNSIINNVMIISIDITKRKLAEETIQRQLTEKEILLKEVHHRIKNNIASIGNILKLQAGSIKNIESQNILQDAISRIESMRIIYDKLLVKYDYKEISVKGYLEELISAIQDIFPEKSNIIVERNIDDFILNVNSLFPIGIIINELITNSMKYAFVDKESGKIDITISKKENIISLIVKDNGNGLPLDFNVDKSTGFGIILVRSLTQQLKGFLSIVNDNGTKCIIEFKI